MSKTDAEYMFEINRLEGERDHWKGEVENLQVELKKWKQLALLHEANAGEPERCMLLRMNVGLPRIGGT